MSTTTKPARSRGKAPPSSDALATRAITAEKVATAARRKAQRIASDEATNRSTRARSALKVKAAALDEVAEILAGKG